MPAKFVYDPKQNSCQCQGSWSVTRLDSLNNDGATLQAKKGESITVSGANLDYFDSAGALALHDIVAKLRHRGYQVTLVDFSEQQLALLDLIEKNKTRVHYTPAAPSHDTFLSALGKQTVDKVEQADGFVVLLGDLCLTFATACMNWRRFRFADIISNIYTTGIQALPILALLSFLIGVVLAYQMGIQLETYGANIFIAYVSGMAIFREFGPLITAIIVAGRTSSSYTAQLGSMKINEEIDVIQTMGLSPTELLVLPKIIGLTLILPLVIFCSNVFGILGAMIMSSSKLGISYIDFLERIRDSVGLKHMLLGLYKAPAFSIIIAMVGCYQGFAVKPNADSIGTQTTKAVVQALFLIIIADSCYTMVYSWMGL